MTDTPDLLSATPETEISELGSQQDVEMHTESDSGQDRTDGTTSEIAEGPKHLHVVNTHQTVSMPRLITGSLWVQMFIVEIRVAKIILNTTMFLIFVQADANSKNPDQTAPEGAV